MEHGALGEGVGAGADKALLGGFDGAAVPEDMLVVVGDGDVAGALLLLWMETAAQEKERLGAEAAM